MSKYIEIAKQYFNDPTVHYNCAESTAVAFADAVGVARELVLDIAGNFGGGMRMASVCGAFSGGLIALGLFGLKSPEITREYTAKIKAKHDNTVICAEMLALSKQRGEEKHDHCQGLVLDCVAAVEEILRANGKIE